jgi:hypothetical protein
LISEILSQVSKNEATCSVFKRKKKSSEKITTRRVSDKKRDREIINVPSENEDYEVASDVQVCFITILYNNVLFSKIFFEFLFFICRIVSIIQIVI